MQPTKKNNLDKNNQDKEIYHNYTFINPYGQQTSLTLTPTEYKTYIKPHTTLISKIPYNYNTLKS